MPFPHFHRTAGGGQVDFSSPNIRRSVLAVTAPMLVAQLLNLLYNQENRFCSKNALHPQGVFFVHKGSKKRRMAKVIRRFLFV